MTAISNTLAQTALSVGDAPPTQVSVVDSDTKSQLLAHFENLPPKPMRWLARDVHVADFAAVKLKNGFYSVEPRNPLQITLPSVTWSDIGRKADRDGDFTSKQEKISYEKHLKQGYDPSAAWFKSLYFPKLKGTVYAFIATEQGSQKVGEIVLNTDIHRIHMFTGIPINTTVQAKRPSETDRKAYANEELASWNNTLALIAPLRPQLEALKKTASGRRIHAFSNMPDDDPYIAHAQAAPVEITSQIKRQIKRQINQNISAEKARLRHKIKSCTVDAYALNIQKTRSVYVAQCRFVGGSYPAPGVAVFELNAAGKPAIIRFAQHYAANASPTGKAVTLALPLSDFMLTPEGVAANEFQNFSAVVDLNPANKGRVEAMAQVIMSETGHHESPFGAVQYVPSAQTGGVWLRRSLDEVTTYIQ